MPHPGFEEMIHEVLSRSTIHLFVNDLVDPSCPEFIEPLADEAYQPKPFGCVGKVVPFDLKTGHLQVYGYFVVDEKGRTLYWERFSGAPFQMWSRGGSIEITPSFTIT